MRTLFLQRNHSVKGNTLFMLPPIRIWSYIMALLITSIYLRINMCHKSFRYITTKRGKNYPHFPEQKIRFNKLKYFDWSHLVNDGIEMLPGYKVHVAKPVPLSLSSFASLHNCILQDLFWWLCQKCGLIIYMESGPLTDDFTLILWKKA